MNQNESLIGVLALIYKWKKHILGASFIAALLVALLSLTLPNYYQASTLFYAASPDMASPQPIGSQTQKKNTYGTDVDLDRLFSIAQSNELKEHLLQTFDLYTHYDIDPEDEKARYKLALKLNKLYDTDKTKYDAINLTVEDTDPVFAAQMANAAREKIDLLSQGVMKLSQKKLLAAYDENVRSKGIQYAKIQDSLQSTRIKYNIFNTASQGEAYSSSLVELEGKSQNYAAQINYLSKAGAPRDSILILKSKKVGVDNQLTKLNKDISSYNAGYSTILSLERSLKDYGEQLNIDKQRSDQLRSVYESNISAIHVIEKAEKPVNKSRPKRSILVIGAAFLTFILMTLWVIIKDQYLKNNWRDQFRNA